MLIQIGELHVVGPLLPPEFPGQLPHLEIELWGAIAPTPNTGQNHQLFSRPPSWFLRQESCSSFRLSSVGGASLHCIGSCRTCTGYGQTGKRRALAAAPAALCRSSWRRVWPWVRQARWEHGISRFGTPNELGNKDRRCARLAMCARASSCRRTHFQVL